MADFRWQSMGGMLVDGNGDLALTLSPVEELGTMTAILVKGSLNAWKLCPGICAGLDSFPGNPVGINQDTELSIQRAVTASLTNQFLPASCCPVQTRCLPGRATYFPARGRTGPDGTQPWPTQPLSCSGVHPTGRACRVGLDGRAPEKRLELLSDW